MRPTPKLARVTIWIDCETDPLRIDVEQERDCYICYPNGRRTQSSCTHRQASGKYSKELNRSRDDGDCPVHGLVPGAAKNVAKKLERTCLIGHEAHPGDLTRDDIRTYVEIRHRKAHQDVGRCEFQHDRHALLQRKFIRGVGEFPGQYLDD